LPAVDGEIAQITEDLVGPYELHDFFLYGLLARGNGASKLYRTALYAFNGKYDEATIEKWLRVFIRRFFTQQFKRSCSPDGPKVTEISLSPRSGLTLATEVSFAEFLRELDENKGEN
jgi:NAD+ synthase (glutamine-hydrolysing)